MGQVKPESGESIWASTAEVPKEPKLTRDIDADVCVVGAGIAGLTTAYMLARRGKSVVVLDDGPVAGGQTQQTTAHLSNAIDDRYFEIERIHGSKGARLAAESHTAAIERIASIVAEEEIECDFTRLDGYLFLAPDESVETLDRELAAAHRAGLTGVERLARAPLGASDTGPCLRFPNQGQFHPLKYLSALAKAIVRDGGRIFTGAHAATIEGGLRARIETADGHAVKAGAVVVATNSPINDMVAIHTKQAPYLTYVIGVPVPTGSVEPGLYWDTLDPYHYIRLQPDEDGKGKHEILIIGGEDHKTGQEDNPGERYVRLESWARERFPMMGEVAYRWAGQVMETLDGLAFIGRNPMDKDNVYIVTGDSGMGMTHGTIAGILLSDLILGRENPWTTLYDPARKPLRNLGEFARENLNVAAQYADWVTGGDVGSTDEVARGQGALIRRGLTKIAAYRDDHGKLHECSAVCPHLGCIVAWNGAEKTWDCPCHGSRFAPEGKVLNGPANTGLEPVAKPE